MASRKGKYIMSSSESEAESDQEVSVAEESSGSFSSLNELTAKIDKLDLQDTSHNFSTNKFDDNISGDKEAQTDDDDDLLQDDNVFIRKSVRKSIVVISSAEESDGDEEDSKGPKKKDTKPALNRQQIIEVHSDEKSPPKPLPKPTRVATKKVPKTKLNLAKLADLEKLENAGKKKPATKRILNLNQLTKDTRSADRAEKDRRKRLEVKHKLFKEIFPNEDPAESLILDFDPEQKKTLVKIHKSFAPHLKPHQMEGIKFMYDCIIESVEQLNEDEDGTGCILAHSMGLGKTFQIVVFLHSILMNRHIQNLIERVLIIVPYNVIENWAQEFDKWFEKCNIQWSINIYEMRNAKTLPQRIDLMKSWFNRGGIMLITSNLFTRTVTSAADALPKHRDAIRKFLLNPGPDLVIIDEGHLLKNDKGTFNQALSFIATNRRIVLTGTPLQNNLSEYWTMVDFVKKNLLGTKEEFKNRFKDPIEEGQDKDSSRQEVQRMKQRIHVLYQLLKGSINRCDYNVLVPYLEPKHEYVLSLKMTEPQIKMYEHYLKFFADLPTGLKADQKNLFRDKNLLFLVMTHPAVVHDYYLESQEKEKENFASKIGTWYQQFVDLDNIYEIEHSIKFIMLFVILEMCEKKGDKLVIFSGSLLNLNLIEKLLRRKMKTFSEEKNLRNMSYKEMQQKTGGVTHRWVRNKDYFRIDGTVDSTARSEIIECFNDVDDKRARLMLVSTRAGGIGTNLIGANRAIIFDASFNPSHDLQAIFRIYRLGQPKPVFVYRFTAYGTMEDKIYKRQIVKQSLSCRVIDEQQIVRHYKKNDLMELYRLDTNYETDEVMPMSDDSLLNDLLFEYSSYIMSYHEHDSLLENKPEEELTDEERKAAWVEYERARAPPPPPSLPARIPAVDVNLNKISGAPVAPQFTLDPVIHLD